MEIDIPTSHRAYEYSPLVGKAIQFRLLTLLPAKSYSSPLNGSISVTVPSVQSPNLADPSNFIEKFEALSYTWGDQKNTSAIFLEGNTFLPIASNLEAFLRHRRETNEPIKLWVDAVCINQADLEERSTQVSLMNMIYLLADHLSVWLGPEYAYSNLAIDELKIIGSDTVFDKLPHVERKSMTAIENLLNRPWWRRAWIIQEVGLGTVGIKFEKAMVYCGTEILRWTNLIVACARMKMNERNERQAFSGVENALVLDRLSERPASSLKPMERDFPMLLLNTIADFRHFGATDPRDKIYGLCGLYPTGLQPKDPTTVPAPPVDYGSCVEEIYAHFANWFAHRSRSLDFLRHCGNIAHKTESALVMLPSWAPDWSIARTDLPLLAKHRSEHEHIPWWSLPTKHGEGYKYAFNQDERRKQAIDIVKNFSGVTLGSVPEWTLDMMEPTMADFMRQAMETGKASDGTPIVIASLNQGDSMEGARHDHQGDGETAMKYKEKRRQRDFLQSFLKLDNVSVRGTPGFTQRPGNTKTARSELRL